MQPTYIAYVRGGNGNVLSFSGKNSNILLPCGELEDDYTVTFQIYPSANNPNDATIFKSPSAVLKLKQERTGKLGFSTSLYHFDFDCVIPENTWTHIVITGTHKGITLYINGRLQKRLYNSQIRLSDKNNAEVSNLMLVFPLQTIGGFYGKIDKLRMWNKILTDSAIRKLSG